MCSSIRPWQLCYHGNILGSRPPHIRSFFGHLCCVILIFLNSTSYTWSSKHIEYVSSSLWPCLPFFKLKITNILKSSGWGLEKSELPWERIFFIAIRVFPVELSACQVSMFCTANRPFYSCLLSDLAFEWQRGWRWPCFDTDLTVFVV